MKEILNIKGVLKSKGMTQEELASKLGVHPVTLSQNLSRNPTVNYLQRIADALGVNIIDLFNNADEKKQYICPHCKKIINIDIEVK
jgi:transcriptional regulator with XRE-family HTH domain